MEIAEVIQTVGNLGFAVFIAIWALKFTFDTMAKNMNSTTEQLTNLAKAINDNTVVLAHLVDELEKR